MLIKYTPLPSIMLTFAQKKADTLAQLHDPSPDHSRKGGVDTQILPLLNTINALDNHYTTSSCAGRFIVLGLTAQKKKHTTSWLYVSHDTVTGQHIIDALNNRTQDIEEIWFKCECPILHVCSKTHQDALWLLNTARNIGLRRSGIIAHKPERIITEIIGTLTFAVPLYAQEPLAIDKPYAEQIAALATTKLHEARQQFEQFKQALSQ